MDFLRALIFLLISISFYSAWKNYRKKVNEAVGEEEMREAFVPFLMITFIFLIAIVTFVF